MDFKKATELFADPDFDGPPVQIYESRGDDDPSSPPETTLDDEPIADEIDADRSTTPTTSSTTPTDDGRRPRTKYVVERRASSRSSPSASSTTTSDGKLITESLQGLHAQAPSARSSRSLDAFLKPLERAPTASRPSSTSWRSTACFFEALADEVGKDLDPFDLVCHVAFDQPPLTRQERAEQRPQAELLHQVRRAGPRRAGRPARQVRRRGRRRRSRTSSVLQGRSRFTELGTPVELIRALRRQGRSTSQAVRELEDALYDSLA